MTALAKYSRLYEFTKPHRDAMGENHEALDGWVKAIVSDFQARYGPMAGERDDLLQEARTEALMCLGIWDPERCALAGYIRVKVFARLFDAYRTKLLRWHRLKPMYVEDLDTVAGKREFDLHAFLDGLSEDAQVLVDVTLVEGKGEQIWPTVKAEGWTFPRFQSAYTEVREALR